MLLMVPRVTTVANRRGLDHWVGFVSAARKNSITGKVTASSGVDSGARSRLRFSGAIHGLQITVPETKSLRWKYRGGLSLGLR